MFRGWGSALLAIVSLAAIFSFIPSVQAVHQGICSGNGYPTNGGMDCAFIRDPTLNACFDQSFPCNADLGGPSKYWNGCIGTTYYDFSQDSATIDNTWFNPTTGMCEYYGDTCTSLGHGIPNSPLCGYVYPGPNPTTPPYNPPGPTPGPVYPPSRFPFCGNGVCEYGENMFNCPQDCSLFVPIPGFPVCSLSSFPSSVQAGGSATIAVNYFNTPFEPLSTLVNCGNGQVALAYGCYGFSGACFAVCNYPQAGTFTATATAGGAFCRGITVSSYGNGITPPPGPGPGPGPIIQPPSPSCAVSTNPSSMIEKGTTAVTVQYNNFQDTPNGNIVCGDGQSLSAQCSGFGQGSCTATCTYSKPQHVPAQFIVTSTLDGIGCKNGGVTIGANTDQGSLIVTVVNQTFDPIQGAAVQVDDGSIQFTNLTGQTQYTLNAGPYTVRASKPQFSTAITTTRVNPDETTRVTLQLNQRFNTFCQVAASPSTVRGGSSSTVSVSYLDVPSVPSSVTVTCGNGQTAIAPCSGTPSQGVCTATCNYGSDPSLPNSFTVSSSVSGLACNSQSVTVVPPLPGTGNLLARVSACVGGQLLSNAQLRVSSPTSLIPTNFSADGSYSLQPSQTVRADNGFIVRLDSVQQVPSQNTTPLNFATGKQNFPTNATDVSTVSQSFVSIQSALPTAFTFNNQNVSTVYYVTDSKPAGLSAQGVIFYQDPTTSNFVPFLHPNALGSVTYAVGKTISGAALSGVSIVNSTNLTGCNSSFPTSTNLGSFTNFTLASPITFSGGHPSVSGYAMSGFSGSALVTAQSVNASCTSGNYTLTFNNAAGSISPGLGVGQYAITYNYLNFNYGVPVTLQFYAPGITVGPNDPNPGNGYVISVPEYLTSANTVEGAWMLDVGFGDQANPRLLAANLPATIGYDNPFNPQDIQATAELSGFLSPRGSTASIALTSANINYALNLASPAASVSFLTPQGALVQQNLLKAGDAVSTANVMANVASISGNTTNLGVRSLTAATPNNSTVFFTNEFGEVNAQLTPGTYNLEFFKDGFNTTHATVSIDAARTNTQAICLPPRACDFSVNLVSAPTCQFNSDQYQLQISNSQNETKNVTLTYSSSEISGPQFVVLAPQQSTIVNLKALSASPAISGQSLGIVNVVGPDSCTSSFTLPLCIQQDIVIQATQPRLSATPGNQVCEDVLVKNRALQTVQVALTSSSSQTSVQSSFSPNSFMLSSLESKTVPLCVTPNSGFSGSATLLLQANSPFGQANDSVAVDVNGQTFYSTDFSGCPLIDAGRTTYYTLNVKNNGPSGDYLLHLDDNPVSVQNDFVLQQFQSGDVRSVVIPLAPFGKSAGRQYFNAYLKKDGQTVMQQPLCFEISGTSNALLDVEPNPLDVPRGQTASALLLVRNLGNLKAQYVVTHDGLPLSVRVSPSSFLLDPNGEQDVQVAVSADASLALQSYTVPLSVYSQTPLQSTTNQYSVDVQCGTGQTQTVTCPPGSGSCSVTCGYLSSGSFSPSASVAGNVCSTASSSVRVIDSNANTCILQAAPNNIDQGTSITVSANYNSLNNPFGSTLPINCGNGQIVTAQNCQGSSGACSATCTYPTQGNFVVTASQNGTSCFNALVAVGNPSSSSCQLTVDQNTVVRGGSSSVQVRYYNLPTTGTTSSLSVPVFKGSQNLLVNVVGASSLISLSTAELTLFAIPPQEAFSGTSLRIPVVVKNENYFPVDNVLIYPDKLPSGFTAVPVPRFSLNPGEQRTVDFVLDIAPSVQPSTVSFNVVAESALTRPVHQTVVLTVLASPSQRLNLDASVNVIYQEDAQGRRFILDMSVTNREPLALQISPALIMNQSWPSSFQPPSVTLTPNAQASIQGQVVPQSDFDPTASYPATVRLRSSDGRFMVVPITLSKSGGSFLSGLLTFGDAGKFFNDLFNGAFGPQTILFYIGVVLLLIAVALMFFAAMHHHVSRGG